jgi:hypothetical protein
MSLLGVVGDEFLVVESRSSIATFSRISAADAFHTNGSASSFQLAIYWLILLMSSAKDLNEPRRIAWRVMIPNQVSTWLIHDPPVGVK